MINWNHIDTVILDMDGTLLDLNFDNHFWLKHIPRTYAEKNDISFQEAQNIIMPKMSATRGTLNWYDVHYWAKELRLDIISLKQELSYLIQPRPGVHEFLSALRRHHKQLWLATNAHQDTISVKFDRVNLTPYLHQVVSSNQLGAPKESIDFWHRLHHQTPFEPHSCLFIDDNLDVLRAAKDYGIQYLLCIKQPDLSAGENSQSEFPALSHFSEITPT